MWTEKVKYVHIVVKNYRGIKMLSIICITILKILNKLDSDILRGLAILAMIELMMEFVLLAIFLGVK